MKQVDWNQYLSESNCWTKRLIGLETFSKIRNLEQIDREYDRDKYGSLLQFNLTDIEGYKRKEFEQAGLSFDQPITISLNEEIFEVQLGLARTVYQIKVCEVVRRYQSKRICELGCGYGYNLSYLQEIVSEVYGGEYSINAVKLANRLGLDVQRFNYYEAKDYDFIRNGSLIFTSHSIEQLPSAKCFLDNITKYKDDITVVVHFEPTFLATRSSLVGLLRNRYLELNDYNRDLINLLEKRQDIEILEFTPDAIGMNPLNPACLIVWKFK